jgi:hypothetical protein
MCSAGGAATDGPNASVDVARASAPAYGRFMAVGRGERLEVRSKRLDVQVSTPVDLQPILN